MGTITTNSSSEYYRRCTKWTGDSNQQEHGHIFQIPTYTPSHGLGCASHRLSNCSRQQDVHSFSMAFTASKCSPTDVVRICALPRFVV